MFNNDHDGNDKHGAREALDGSSYAGEPSGSYEPHPLFPLEDNSPELRDIQFISFRRRSSDGAIDNLAEDIPAGEVLTWADVVGPWGGGEYKAIGKDQNHRIVAWYPERDGEWVRFDLESKPFTLRGQCYRPAPPHPLEATLAELLHELRATRTSMPTPSANDRVLLEVLKSQGELLLTVLGSALARRPIEPSLQSNSDPMALTLQVLGAVQKLMPTPQTPPSINDRLSEYRTFRELTTPSAPSPSELGELKDLMMSVMRTNEPSKSPQEVTMQPPGPERRPPPLPREDDRPVDYEALLRDPNERQRLLSALGLDRPVSPATAVAAAPLPEAPAEP